MSTDRYNIENAVSYGPSAFIGRYKSGGDAHFTFRYQKYGFGTFGRMFII